MNIDYEVNQYIKTLRLFNNDVATVVEQCSWNRLNNGSEGALKRMRKIMKHNFDNEKNRQIFRSIDMSATKVYQGMFPDPAHSRINVRFAEDLVARHPKAKLYLQRMMIPWDLPNAGTSLATLREQMANHINRKVCTAAIQHLNASIIFTTQLQSRAQRAESRVNGMWTENCQGIKQQRANVHSIVTGLVRTLLPAFFTTPMNQFINTWLSHWAKVAGANAPEEQPTASVSYEQMQEMANLKPGEKAKIGFSKSPNPGFYTGGNHSPVLQWFMEGNVNAANNLSSHYTDKFKNWIIAKIQQNAIPDKNLRLSVVETIGQITGLLQAIVEEFETFQKLSDNDNWLYRQLVQWSLFENREAVGGVKTPRAGGFLADMLNNIREHYPERFAPNFPAPPNTNDQVLIALEHDLTCLLLRERMAANHHFYVTHRDLPGTKSLDHHHSISDQLINSLVSLGVLTKDTQHKKEDRAHVDSHDFTRQCLYFGKNHRAHNTKLLFKFWVLDPAVENHYLRSINAGVYGRQAAPNPALRWAQPLETRPQPTAAPVAARPPRAQSAW